MAAFKISRLPTEIQLSIAELCKKNDLINLCLTSKRMKDICLPILYRHVDLLPLDRYDKGIRLRKECYRILDASMRQQQFVRTLLDHPEYGQLVKSWKGMLSNMPVLDDDNYFKFSGTVSDEDLWRAMQSLTKVQDVDVGSRNGFAYRIKEPMRQFPHELFQSATSVRLAGHMQYGLAKAILNAINPATLKHLCLDMVQDRKILQFQQRYAPGGRDEDGHIIALSAISGLLTPLTGRCTALRTLILRREGRRYYDDGRYDQHGPAEEASYMEWASFICSVQSTLEKFTFELSGKSLEHMGYMNDCKPFNRFRNMGERFRRLVLPAIISGSWPCLTFMKIRGVRIRNSNDVLEKAALKRELRAALGGNVRIVVKEQVRFLHWAPYG